MYVFDVSHVPVRLPVMDVTQPPYMNDAGGETRRECQTETESAGKISARGKHARAQVISVAERRTGIALARV